MNCFPGFCAAIAAISLLTFFRLSFRYDCCCILVLRGVLGWDGSLTSVYDGLSLGDFYGLFVIYLYTCSFTYDHRTLKTRLPVRSALFKQRTGGLVVRWVTTSEYPLLYVFGLFFRLFLLLFSFPKSHPIWNISM